ncbi:MAG: CSLREA domain-containing protein [Moraxellaceae bacterium]|nr:CSLREA domain-containing protein [Moraxellaceae bacterium]
MPVSQSRLLICLLASSLLSTTSLADSVIINTTADENNIDNQSCSLREAVSYLNAKNTKKALIDEEVAVISGTSAVLNTNLVTAKQDLATEQAKATPDSSKITQLNNTINDLIIRIDAGLVGLNRKLDETNDALDKEKSRATPDATLINAYELSITDLKAKIKIKEEEKNSKINELKEYRSKGLFGCFSYDDGSTESIMMLTLPKPYILDTSLTINLGVAINGNSISTSTDGTINKLEDSTLDLPLRPIIKANGNHQLLVIDDSINNTLSTPPIFVTFNNIDFIGCEQFCAANGGIIFNKEALSITQAVISKGQANHGGAIYNAETATLLIKQSVFKENQATNDGAAIYSTDNNISLDATLVTKTKQLTEAVGLLLLILTQ